MLRVAEHFAKSDTGRQRSANQDALLARAPVFVVADGMGGAQAGEVASRMAVEAFQPSLPDDGSPEERLARRAQEANGRIHDYASADQSRAGMGTTLTAAYVGEREVSIAHVGDSRMYLLRGGELSRLTQDHSLVQEWVRRGRLTEEEAEEHPQRSIITRALGPEPEVDVETRTFPAQPDDVFLLCSDGLTSMVPERRVAELLRESTDLDAAGQRLVDEANAAGGRDNISVILFRLEDVGGPDGAAEQPTQAGADALSTEEIRRELEAAEEGGEPRRPREPRPPQPPDAGRRAHRRTAITLAVLLLGLPMVGGAALALRAVYFIGTTDSGQVAVFRGLPYELPGGLRLYSKSYVSGTPVTEIPPARRESLLDHQLRSEEDAADLVRDIELGRVES